MSYLRFVDSVPTGKTKSWSVSSTDGHYLGTVRFSGAWRKYCFFPKGDTQFDASCLREIADFCEKETAAWRTTLKS